jgi:hypothetical protein
VRREYAGSRASGDSDAHRDVHCVAAPFAGGDAQRDVHRIAAPFSDGNL